MKKPLFLGTLVLIAILITNIYYYNNKTDEIIRNIYQTKTIQMKKMFQKEVEKKFGKTFALTYLLSQDKRLIEALTKKDRTLIDYKKTVEEIQKYGEYKNLWIQVVDSKGYSFYRSWTKKVGDHAASARIDIADMIKDPKPMRGISTGRFDMTFKTMMPLFKEGEFIGLIEIISKFNSIAKLLKDRKIEPLMILHEDYKRRFIKPFTGLFIKDHYVANLNASKRLMDKAEEYGIKKLMYLKNYTLFENYLVTTDQIKDIHGGDMGFFIFFFNEKDIDKSKLYNFKTDYFIKIIIALTILILLILYLINTRYAKELNRQVEKKTKKIKQQKEKLKSLLKIYDDNVIFSKTDTKGLITHASKAFCKISGYTKKELIGKPHNIVRHEDIPGSIFKNMWATIKSGKTWSGEVKNLRKDGGYYWVHAEIEPEYQNGNLIGYSAIRRDITQEKEIEEIQKDVIFTMGSIGESRSKETGNHVKRVAEYSKLFAKYYGLSKKEQEMLKQASPMHDIGKVGIPDDILNKPARLTEDEREIMKTHSQIGYEMLKNSDRPLLKTAAIVALEHHEKWDGTGYPNGLEGEDIHIYGRITAIADVFDALGSHRCYKEAWEDEKIFKLFKEESGKQFDPTLVNIFFEYLDEFLVIRDKFKDIL